MPKRNLAVDFDDVVAEFNQAYIEHHNKMYAVPPMRFEDARTYDLTVLYGVDHQTMIRRIRRFCHEHHDEIAPYAGVGEGLAILSERYSLHIVTSRCESLTEITTEWLREYGLLRHFSELHFTNGFGTIHPERIRNKLEVCRAIEAVALVEDAPGNAQLVADAGMLVLMPNRPWNESFAHDHVRPFKHWDEVPGLV